MLIKDNVKELAFFGGNPVFNQTLHVGEPNIGNKDSFYKRIDTIFRNNWLTNNGAFVKEFERKIEKLIGVKHCIAMTNKNIRCNNMNSHNEYCLSHNTRNTQYIKILNNHVILDISTIIIGYL